MKFNIWYLVESCNAVIIIILAFIYAAKFWKRKIDFRPGHYLLLYGGIFLFKLLSNFLQNNYILAVFTTTFLVILFIGVLGFHVRLYKFIIASLLFFL